MIYPKAATSDTSDAAPQGAASDGTHPGAALGVPATPNFPGIEREVLGYWEADDTFRASIERRDPGTDGDNEFVFYDGPPFANGLPHYGHLLTGYVKDLVPRYQTMRGKRVERRFGWDTHGLPAELEAMSQLGIKTKDEILELGIETFNAKCRESVLKYTDEWENYVTRQARWVDFEGDYKTLNAQYMESVIWAFKELYDKGLVYEGFRILPYCWNDETPLSNHELRMDDDVYQMRQDPAITVGYRLDSGELALIWTTTPWTLPSNMGIAVHPDVEYVVVESDASGRTERYVIAEPRLRAYAKELFGDATAEVQERIVQRLTGADLVGRSYTPPFSYYEGKPHAHQVHAADFVTTEDGTGIVHMSPGFGEEDKAVLDAAGVETVVPVGPDGRFVFPVTDYEGMHVFDANPVIIDHLKGRTYVDGAGGQAEVGSSKAGTVLLRRETYDHSYPHCWRCRKPLIYMAVSSWFVEVTKFKDRMVELNQEITWVPEHVKDGQFGKWLENARDWSISRNRFWGSPIPVWKSDDPRYPRIDVYGSFAQFEADFGELPRNAAGEPDLHRPFVDHLTRPNPDDPTGQSTMRRVEDVLDVWFDSGSMSFAQVHYPFENADWFEAPLPRRLHRRVHRADPRLVLHDAHHGVGALRPAGLPHLPEPRHRARQRRPEDVQVAAQLPRRARGLRPRRRGRDALVPHEQPDPARGQSRRHRAGHPRGRAPGAAAAVEHVVLLLALRQCRRGRARDRRDVVDLLDRRARPLPAGQAARARRGGHGRPRRVRHRGGV